MLWKSKKLPLWSRVVAAHLIETSYHTHHIVEGEFGIIIGHWDGGWFDRLMRGVQNKIDGERKIINCEPSTLTIEEILTHSNEAVRGLAL